MNILFICCAYSQYKADSYRYHSKRGYQFAAQTFQSALISGFLSNSINVTVLSFPALSTYPFGYKRPFIRNCDFIFDDINLGKSLGFINLPFLKHPTQFQYGHLVTKWLDCNSKSDSAIIVYGFNKKLIDIAKYARKKRNDIPIILIVPDLPEFLGCNAIYTRLGLQKNRIYKLYSSINLFDGFVLLTERMRDKMNFGNKPYVVIEGIYKDEELDQPDISSDQNSFKILYSGALDKRYGICQLLEAFSSLNYADCQLLLCGNGDAVPDIINYSNADGRIKYLGSLPVNKVRQLQKEASLLINPRSSKEEFTKYSFPSKTMEYMASGTPTLMSKLKCIPEEYYPYLLFFETDSISGIKDGIERIYHMDKTERSRLGQKASFFIKQEKNAKKQTSKVLYLLTKLTK